MATGPGEACGLLLEARTPGPKWSAGVSQANICEQCAELDKRIPLSTPARYLTLAGATRKLVAAGTLVLVEGSVPLESLQPGQPLPSDGTDSIRHLLACATCGRRYVLWADTYHGGAWEPSIEA
jgi:hypothetical protein